MRKSSDDLPRYVVDRSYQWNYEHPPDDALVERGTAAGPLPGDWRFCGLPVGSPLGVAAGPLLNGAWCLYYARLGFDVLTYKTVRSRARACYPQPNLVPVACDMLAGGELETDEAIGARSSWAVSFGMPSQAPEVWRADVRAARRRLSSDKLLSVSVVGTADEATTLEQLADDYAQCAAWAFEAGADSVELNFSCPNVSSCDGQLYQRPESAAVVGRRVRERVGVRPLLVKLGHIVDRNAAEALLGALAPWVTAVVATNSIATRVRGLDGQLRFAGQLRGICGQASREASLRQVGLLRELIDRQGWELRVVGVGGIFTARHVRAYLDAGAESVQLATAPMQQPAVALTIRRGMAAARISPARRH